MWKKLETRVQIPLGAFNPRFESQAGLESTVFCLGNEPKGKYQRALAGLLNSTTSQNQKLIYEFLEKECLRKGLGDRRKEKYTRIIKKALIQLDERPLSSFCQDDVDNYFYWLKNSDLADDTKDDYWKIFRIFVEWLKPKLHVRDYKLQLKLKRKLPEEILTEEEVKQIIEVAHSTRDKALISLLYHSGCRAGELTGLKIKDLSFDQYGAVIIVNGKTGMRRIRLIEPVTLLAQYLQEHRYRKEPYAPLFYRADKHYKTPLTSTAINNLLKSCAQKAGITKRVYNHGMRHAKATHMSKFLTEQELKVYFGWVRSSTVAVYCHLSGKDIENKLFQMHGIQSDTEKYNSVILKPVSCLRCSFNNDSSAKFCSKCGLVLDVKDSLNLPTSDKDFQMFLLEIYKKWKENKL